MHLSVTIMCEIHANCISLLPRVFVKGENMDKSSHDAVVCLRFLYYMCNVHALVYMCTPPPPINKTISCQPKQLDQQIFYNFHSVTFSVKQLFQMAEITQDIYIFIKVKSDKIAKICKKYFKLWFSCLVWLKCFIIKLFQGIGWYNFPQRLCIIVNLKPCVQNILFLRGRVEGQWKKMLIPYIFNILAHFLRFSWQIIHLKNVDVFTF